MKQELSPSQSQPVLTSNGQPEAEPSAARMIGAVAEPFVGWMELTDAQRADIEAHIRGLLPGPETYDAPADGWQCFHCGERFRTYGGARLHFGGYSTAQPLCTAETIKSAIRAQVQLAPTGRGMDFRYEFTDASLDRAARAILKASDAAAPVTDPPPITRSGRP